MANTDKDTDSNVLSIFEGAVDIDLAHLHHPRAKYTVQQKITSVTEYFATGSYKAAASAAGVPESTIKEWKKNAKWWFEVYSKIKEAKQEELDIKLTHTLHDAINKIVDRLHNGDNVVLQKTGEVVSVPVSAKDAAFVVATLFDRRQLIRGDATQINEKIGHEEALDKLKEQFEDFAKSVRETESNGS